MEESNLPTEVAQEPLEEARLSQGDKGISPSMSPVEHRKAITFAEATQSTENGSQASTSGTYRAILSQPAPSLSHRQRLQWLQKRRAPGLWAQCDACDRWRFLADVVDAQELPANWTCNMNPDRSAADCSVPEAPLRLREEEDLIHGAYSAGSVVWARLAGWPWWPAMVDDCPDTEQYYWLDGFSDIPTHYNVVFFDAYGATRAWIAPSNLKPYREMSNVNKPKKYRQRLEIAATQAEDAMNLTLEKRLAKHSFIARYTGFINQPREISKKELMKFEKKLKRMYDVEFVDDSSDDENKPINKQEATTVIKKTENMLLVGTPNSKRIKRSRVDKNNEDIKFELNKRCEDTDSDIETTTQQANNDLNHSKQPDSVTVQVGSSVTSTVADTIADVTFDNDTSATYAPPACASESDTFFKTVSEPYSEQKRAVSPNSDDFDFKILE